MLLKKLLKHSLLIPGLTITTLSLTIVLFLSFNLPAQGANLKTTFSTDKQPALRLVDRQLDKKSVEIVPLIAPGTTTDSGLPVRLIIPKIQVNALLESVGLTPKGAMDIPKNPANAAWYNLGTLPGDEGSAVIAGHYGRWKNGQGSVFDNLNKLKKGDKIYVETAEGERVAFIVRKIQKYKAQAEASEIFFSTDGQAHLNLITCDGAYDKLSGTFPRRLIVFADKE
ncbi:TPA: hypothetical protein DCZ15_00260 [Candidatus Falkowbacteria bacterium]|nr:MAG: Sortase (Surface protein transpeptidase) [Candidatus Falkowbacteria bacterium GW2011_GWF2_43_32]HBA36294.1 hypothetical protein [Candidatus Falkowbacteria bacterium]